jgi:hypothetical protein
VAFLKTHPKYTDNGMVNIIVNCKGVIVQCEIDNKTKNPELDAQIVAIFNSLGDWTAGLIKGKSVDTSNLISFTIKKGKFKL